MRRSARCLMEGLRYLAAVLSAAAVAAAVHGWLRRESTIRTQGVTSPPPGDPLGPRESGVGHISIHPAIHLALLVPLALGMAWVDRHAPGFTLAQSLLLLYLLYPLAVLDW